MAGIIGGADAISIRFMAASLAAELGIGANGAINREGWAPAPVLPPAAPVPPANGNTSPPSGPL